MRTISCLGSNEVSLGLLVAVVNPDGSRPGMSDCVPWVIDLSVPGERACSAVVLVPQQHSWKLEMGQHNEFDWLNDVSRMRVYDTPRQWGSQTPWQSPEVVSTVLEIDSETGAAETGSPETAPETEDPLMGLKKGFKMGRKMGSSKFVQSTIVTAIERRLQETGCMTESTKADKVWLEVFGRGRAALQLVDTGAAVAEIVFSRRVKATELKELLPTLPKDWHDSVRTGAQVAEPLAQAAQPLAQPLAQRWPVLSPRRPREVVYSRRWDEPECSCSKVFPKLLFMAVVTGLVVAAAVYEKPAPPRQLVSWSQLQALATNCTAVASRDVERVAFLTRGRGWEDPCEGASGMLTLTRGLPRPHIRGFQSCYRFGAPDSFDLQGVLESARFHLSGIVTAGQVTCFTAADTQRALADRIARELNVTAIEMPLNDSEQMAEHPAGGMTERPGHGMPGVGVDPMGVDLLANYPVNEACSTSCTGNCNATLHDLNDCFCDFAKLDCLYNYGTRDEQAHHVGLAAFKSTWGHFKKHVTVFNRPGYVVDSCEAVCHKTNHIELDEDTHRG
ncbi:hypothetical protein GNI_175060 [Gregarina niphandrodes]|uniref:Uncharacterized protein n=1 Tax=Gregarina niphandrodes TaxID=110365 RepID=A0A023AXM6_GRENI|nr:hypothetical protein GNI_175060 [Gregarina niphandrodes]EZG43379.1 hypothetical protein GNI_175060 [Gregarina niphandrodes]|eukprot:XP_011134644.1 hypothetical protein GNI_175060 [Gregarina niphandrodes]